MSEAEVIRALQVFCNTKDNQERENADKWLQNWKDSADPSSWNILFSIFRNESYPSYVHHFVAVWLHQFTKSYQHWKLLEEKTHKDLVNTIISFILQGEGKYETVVIRQLCFVLCDIGIRTHASTWPTFFLDMFNLIQSGSVYECHYLTSRSKQMGGQMPEELAALESQKVDTDYSGVKSLLLTLSSDAANRMCVPILELLACLPLEIESSLLTIGKKEKDAIIFDCKVRTAAIIYSLQKLNSLPGAPNQLILTCINNWASEFPILPQLSSESGLLRSVFNGFQNSRSCELFSQIFVQIMTPKEWHKFPTILNECIAAIGSLHNLIDSDDYEITKAVARVTSTMIEYFPEEIVSAGDNGKQVISLALKCTAYSDKDIFEMMLECWYILLYHYEDDVDNIPDSIKPYLSSVYKDLLQILLKQGTYDDDCEDWDESEFSEFIQYRTNIADTFRYCHAILEDDYFKILISLLEKFRQSGNSWQYLDVVIFALSAAGECIQAPSTQCVPVIFKNLFLLPKNNPYLYRTMLILVREYAEHLALYPDLLSSCFNLITEAIKTSGLVNPATAAMSQICRYCDDSLVQYYDQIYEIFSPSLNSLDISERGSIIEGLARLICKLEPEKGLISLQKILEPIMIDLQNVLSLNSSDMQERIVQLIEMLSTICASCKFSIDDTNQWDALMKKEIQTSHPLIKAFEPLWPKIMAVQSQFSTNFQLAEHINKLIKNILTSTGTHATPLVVNMSSASALFLKTFKHQVFFITPAFIFSAYYDQTVASQNPVVSQFLAQYLEHIKTTFVTCMKQGTDVLFIRGYYSFLWKIFTRVPNLRFSSPATLNESIEVGLYLIPNTTHTGSLKDVSKFFELFFTPPPAKYIDITERLVQSLGPMFTKVFIEGICHSMTKNSMLIIAASMFKLKKTYPRQVQEWIIQCLSDDNIVKSKNISKEEKMKFVQQVAQSKNDKEFLVASLELYQISRGWNSNIVDLS